MKARNESPANGPMGGTAGFLPALLILVLFVSGCAGNPASGGSSVVFSSRGGEIRVGKELHEQFVEKGSLYDDEELQAYVNKIGQRLVENSGAADLEFTFHVIDSPDINAFALPGGYIYINRGLLAYLNSEAQLAGVLGHEIGHITARHHGRRKTASVTNTALAVTVLVLTGSGGLAEVSNMYGAELISGYGRDMELEADSLGARYMHASGYDPDALLELIGVLKNHERYQRLQASAAGNASSTYHGLFATHPRNDKRLRTVINAAAQLDLDSYIENPEVAGEFKQRTDNMVWGESIQGERAENRYYHDKLGFSLELPTDWTVEPGATAIILRAPDNSATLTLSLRRKNPEGSPRSTLEGNARGELENGKKLDRSALDGYTAVASADAKSKRLAVVDYKNYSYLFEGAANDFAAADKTLLATIESFRPMLPDEENVGPGQRLRYLQLPRNKSIADLAAETPVVDAENILRLINDLYPAGEPRTGDWVKIIE